MVAEDNVVNRLVITSFLDHVDCKVVFAENGQQAVNQFEKRQIDLILMDIHMPVKDGIEATEEIRALERQRKLLHTPIIAVTAHDDEDHRRRCNAVGMDGFIAKPLKSANFISMVSLWLFGSLELSQQSV
ncbi:MAG: response regulator [Pseudomonadota bacterium]